MTASTIAGRQPAAWQARLRAALPGHLERRTWDAARLRAHQRDRLRALLRHATSRSRFHAERLAGVDPARFELADLPALPTMTKAEMMAGLDDLLTDARLSRAALERHLAGSSTEATSLLGEYVVLASGGAEPQRPRPAALPRAASTRWGADRAAGRHRQQRAVPGRCARPRRRRVRRRRGRPVRLDRGCPRQREPDDPAIVLASDLAIVELVDADNLPVPSGTPSAKALVTNLINPAQPLIR